MPKYNIRFQIPAFFEINIEADDKEDAHDKAMEAYEDEVYKMIESNHLSWEKVGDTAEVELLGR